MVGKEKVLTTVHTSTSSPCLKAVDSILIEMTVSKMNSRRLTYKELINA